MNEKDVEEVRQKTNLVELIAETHAVEKIGSMHFAKCQKHPSRPNDITINTRFGSWAASCCDAGGDVILWIMYCKNLEFPEAVNYLQEKLKE